MNYIYDIYLNFNKNFYDFCEWDKNDKIIHVKSIPLYKVSEECIKNIYKNNFTLSKEEFKNILRKSITWNKCDKYRNYALFADNNNIIAIEFDNNGNSIKRSSLIVSEELEILESIYKMKEINIDLKNKRKIDYVLKTRKQIDDEFFIKNELLNMDIKKLQYIFFECFNKKELNKQTIINKLINLSKNSKINKNLYSILKLTSTYNK